MNIGLDVNNLKTNDLMNQKGTHIAYQVSLCYPESRTLFRYRPSEDYCIDALRNDELWLSAAKTFNDPYDSLCYINMQKMPDAIFKAIGIPVPPKYIDKISACREYEKVFKDMGRNRKIACFTEDITSTVMWGHYASGSKGFAIEYCIDDMLKELMGYFPCILPVIYSDKKYDATREAINWFRSYWNKEAESKVDALLLVKPVIRKGVEWKYEREWRFIDAPARFNNDKDYEPLPFIKPKAVYIGLNMPNDKELELSTICKYKGIDIYKMSLDNSEEGNKLIPLQY